MKVAEYAKRTAIRRVVYIVIAAVIALATQLIGTAAAQTPNTVCTPGNKCSYSQALSYCNADIQHAASQGSNTSGVICKDLDETQIGMVNTASGNCPNFNSIPRCSYYHTGAPPNECPNKPAIQNLLAVVSSSSGAGCFQGCFYAPAEEVDVSTLHHFKLPAGLGFTPVQIHEGAKNWRPTGASCDQPSENKPYSPDKPVCVQQGSLTQCVQPDGKFCVTATSGKRICWNPGETGQKTTQAGDLAGDRQVAPAVPSTTGIEGGTSQTGQHGVNNVTYNQDIKTGGTQSGPQQSNPGDGGADDTDGDGKPEDKGSASGGGTCGAPPTCSGDPINCAILQQQWQTRCKDDKNDDGQPDWTEGEGPDPDDSGTPTESDYKRFNIPMGTDGLDTENIFGEGTCPNFSITVMGFDASTADIPAWCDYIAPILRAVILLFGAYTAIQILQGRMLS